MKQQKTYWLLGLTVAATLPLAQPAQAGLFGLSEQDEIRAGQQVAAQAQKEYGRALPASHPMQRRVRAIGMQFARLSSRKNIPYSYTVLQNDKVLNAFAAPGGPIFVTTKLVNTTKNDAELAYVLGHETAHIDRRHIVEQVEKQQKAGLLAGIAGAILGRGSGGNAIGAIANVGWAVVSSGYSRKDENEADAVGARFMSQLGYDPRAAVTMLAKLDTGSRGGGLDKYLSTHPAPKSRQAAVSQQITKENLLDVARRAGGPRLTMEGSTFSPTSYSDGAPGATDRYPDDPSTDTGAATTRPRMCLPGPPMHRRSTLARLYACVLPPKATRASCWRRLPDLHAGPVQPYRATALMSQCGAAHKPWNCAATRP
jgi:Zn-dependent protease with chaperone function